MERSEYSRKHTNVTLNEFLSLSEDDAICFDFYTQGEEADRTILTNAIYAAVFPWYNLQEHAGDTLMTYKSAIMYFYKKAYPNLERSAQKQILSIIRTHTNGSHFYEETYINKDGIKKYRLLNNSQLGNFALQPIRGGVNPKRAQRPYYDFFDLFLEQISNFYSETIVSNDDLKSAIIYRSDYFNEYFHNDWKEYLNKNYFHSFIQSTGHISQVIELSKCGSFTNYVILVNKIVERRGRELYRALKAAANVKEKYSSHLHDSNIKNLNKVVNKEADHDYSELTESPKYEIFSESKTSNDDDYYRNEALTIFYNAKEQLRGEIDINKKYEKEIEFLDNQNSPGIDDTKFSSYKPILITFVVLLLSTSILRTVIAKYLKAIATRISPFMSFTAKEWIIYSNFVYLSKRWTLPVILVVTLILFIFVYKKRDKQWQLLHKERKNYLELLNQKKKELDKERDYHLAIYRNSDQYRLMKDQIPKDLLDEDKINHMISLLYSGKATSLDDVYWLQSNNDSFHYDEAGTKGL